MGLSLAAAWALSKWAHRTPHVVLSTSLNAVAWKSARIVRELDDIARLKQQDGKDGGAALVGSLIERELVDELRLATHPVLLGRGKPCSRSPLRAPGRPWRRPGPCLGARSS